MDLAALFQHHLRQETQLFILRPWHWLARPWRFLVTVPRYHGVSLMDQIARGWVRLETPARRLPMRHAFL